MVDSAWSTCRSAVFSRSTGRVRPPHRVCDGFPLPFALNDLLTGACCLQPTARELRVECKQKGLDSSGRKADLEARLKEYAAAASVGAAASAEEDRPNATVEPVMEPREEPPSKRRKEDDTEVIFHWP